MFNLKLSLMKVWRTHTQKYNVYTKDQKGKKKKEKNDMTSNVNIVKIIFLIK